MALELPAVAAGFALLAPVYALLFQIQQKLGRFEARIAQVEKDTQE